MQRLSVVVALLSFASGPASSGEEPLTFERDVRPILKAFCLDCHGGDEELRGKLDLRLKRFAERGGRSGTALVPGEPDESLILIRMQDAEMPPGDVKVPDEEIEIVERWIAQGALTVRDEPESLPPGIDITPEDRAFWVFQPLERPEVPRFGPEALVRTPIDAFVLAKLREAALDFAPEADRRTLIRRLAFDLTGLPPSAEEIEAFENDDGEDAYERLVERLLDSPHYGERWGRHWLDVAGYADSDGDGTTDTPRPYAYKYRDYVVRSLNADTPLDRFIIEQLAGDELVPRPWTNLTPEQIETLSATGFLRMVPDTTSSGAVDLAEASNQVVGEALQVVGSAFLGLTVGCAQCHDHRYDPIPQEDYFRLRAVFEPAFDPQNWRRPTQRLVSLYTDEERAQAEAIEAEARNMQEAVDAKTEEFLEAALETELEKFPEELRGPLRDAYHTPADERTDEQKALLDSNPSVNITAGVLYQYNQKAADELQEDRNQIAEKRAEKPFEDFVSVLDEVPGVRPETRLFHRGDYRQPTRLVHPGDLTIAAPDGERFEIEEDDPDLETSGRRLAFSKHLLSGSHPLVGRVLANRIWLHHFGRGLVDTPGDFGALGVQPSHPELLDWLATELPRQGWSLKAMHRLILTSHVYRQSSRRDPSHDAIDSENALYARYPLRRLDAESVRDHILVVSGRLDRTLFGPSVSVAEDSVGQVLPENDSPRRSLYLQVRRTQPVSLLSAFDGPTLTPNCDRRRESTSSQQALMLMNSDFLREHAEAFARRLSAEPSPTFEHEETLAALECEEPALDSSLALKLEHAWRLAYGRPITQDELDSASAFVAEQLEASDPESSSEARELSALTDLCQQLLISNEFLYVD